MLFTALGGAHDAERCRWRSYMQTAGAQKGLHNTRGPHYTDKSMAKVKLMKARTIVLGMSLALGEVAAQDAWLVTG